MMTKLHALLRRVNRYVALILGLVLIATVLFILTDVMLRAMGRGSLGGSDEISGYVVAAVASWGLSFALLERAHVRIDFIRQKLAQGGQIAMDIFALIVTNAVIVLIAVHCWPVLEKTLARGAKANTPLETPLWIPQGIWFSGWVWFAVTATLLTLIALSYMLTGQRAGFDAAAGIGSEVEQ
ncbi:MAG: TRAP transporter small permease [Paracoccus sp. (in: a-proteobacteria)]|uniref:TRAP transporter small permease subunit n=1 Tax=Paracoccus sp. TaxID=267 RepID=UPI0026DF0869|nr:TRAP transporter small permease [Paracoccus sp. (in: a-proteobacteria)]MDO5622951.1 TRAP transporter small permease [Paracoccus sp. (in: a-proteobacteria)]